MAETRRERRERLTNEHGISVARFVYGEAPKVMARYSVNEFGQKVYHSYEDYLNG